MKSAEFISSLKKTRSKTVTEQHQQTNKPVTAVEAVLASLPPDFDPFDKRISIMIAEAKRKDTPPLKPPSGPSIVQVLESLSKRYDRVMFERAAEEDAFQSMMSNKPIAQLTNPYDKIDYKNPFKTAGDDADDTKKKTLAQPKAPQSKKSAEPDKSTQPTSQPRDDHATKKDKDKPKKEHYYTLEKVKSLAGKMGNNLYAISDWEYNYRDIKSTVDPDRVPSLRSREEPVTSNRILRNVIQSLGTDLRLTRDISEFLSIDRENFWHGGSIHAIILNDTTNQLFFFVADPSADFSTLISGGYVEAARRVPRPLGDSNLTKEQNDTLDNLRYLGDQYVKTAGRALETDYRHGYEEAVELRRRLLNALGLGEGYTPPLDRDPRDIEAEREHKRKKADNEPGHVHKGVTNT